MSRLSLTVCLLTVLGAIANAVAAEPTGTDYCLRLQQEIQGKKHGFLAGNLTYYVGGFHASWNLREHETIGLTHPFSHDLRSRGVGLAESGASGHENTGVGNDFSGWEFYKDTRVMYGTVIVGDKIYRHPVPDRMYWRPDRMVCEYELDGIRLHEEKFIAGNDAACSVITSSQPVTLRIAGQSYFGRHSVSSTASIDFDVSRNTIHITEGGVTKCKPETDRSEQTAPIMYQGMSTVLTASQRLDDVHQFTDGPDGEKQYSFDLKCDQAGVTLVWAMHDEYEVAARSAQAVVNAANDWKTGKTQELNRQLNQEIPWFRCSDRKFEDIYYYLWSLYLMYYIDVQSGWEMEPHTQTAVNNFLGMHRYDATFQIKVGAWTGSKKKYAYGNVLTWKHLFASGNYRKSRNGMVAFADNKGTTWHSGVYGLEHSEHVLGAWQIYQHTGDVGFLRKCYQGYFREVFWDGIPSFFGNHFAVSEILCEMARLVGSREDVAHWQQSVRSSPEDLETYFEQRWEANGHRHFFAGPQSGMLMTTGLWHLRSKYFPRDYAEKIVNSWALDSIDGFQGKIFPRAMSGQAMKKFATAVDHSFGYTPDTAYFTLDGMFRQGLGDPAWRLTLNHFENYNFHPEWKVPVAPEAYTRSGELFGDQYSNFNAGKILLFLEGLAGLDYSLPENRLTVRDTMPTDWDWMEFRLPVELPSGKNLQQLQKHWPTIRFDRTRRGDEVTKTVRVTDCPLGITIEPWSEGKQVASATIKPVNGPDPIDSRFPDYKTYRFENGSTAQVELRLLSP
ncbi:hypothetical protein OAF37_03020 [Rubripirellula sp.]|nr:hypothetical protein [Rubripirellula sp.]MDB4621972.1 hypothetical protein [Rubripirellula sp.]MDB4645009.1 hypothetical protein [Rubripirellula sp.]